MGIGSFVGFYLVGSDGSFAIYASFVNFSMFHEHWILVCHLCFLRKIFHVSQTLDSRWVNVNN